MTFQEILEGITRHRANPMAADVLSEIGRKISEIEWALQAIAEELRDREQEFKTARDEALAAVKEHSEREEDFDDVDEAFDEYEKRK